MPCGTADGTALAVEDEIGEDGANRTRDRPSFPAPRDDRGEHGRDRDDTWFGVLRVLAGDGDETAHDLHSPTGLLNDLGECGGLDETLAGVVLDEHRNRWCN